VLGPHLVLGFGLRDSGFGFRVSVCWFRVSGFGFRVSGFGFRVSGFGATPHPRGGRVSETTPGYSAQPRTPCSNTLSEMCSGSEAGSYVRLIDFVYHSTLG